ncbi:MAG: GntP family permease [Tissierellia bacterium]|nr:GntP family permease [Tissierellia bacterium]
MIGIFLGLAALVFLAYRGYNIVWAAPIAALVVAVTGGLNLFEAYTETYMEGLVGFTKSWFPVFLFGAIYGKMMEMTGAAKAVAQLIRRLVGSSRAILSVVIACAALTYGGVSLFVVVFAIYPMAVELFREADISNRLIPGTISLGAFTFTMTALPGSPQLNNLIASKYLGTTTMAAPILGIVAGGIMLGCGYLWLKYRENLLRKKGEHFVDDLYADVKDDQVIHSHWGIGLLSLITVVLTLNLLKWHAIIAIGAGILILMVAHIKQYKKFAKTLNEAATGAVTSILNTAAAVGFGTVVKTAPGFAILTEKLLGLGGSPLLSEAVAITTLAGATGSSSGGMTIALEALAPKYLEIAATAGISPEAFHRVATVASGGLDTLPHCGAVITLLSVCRLKHSDSYFDIGMVCCVFPVLAAIAIVILGSMGIV